ncbi:anti-sigma regulatory factor [Caloranaerobacter sp. TR13]|uniref:ATP-binding protein n=1 Tax=Caloranaerobacter sp. TR13 TaxID=1302151 RepID=UPI0006D4850B|nr:anti-sigma regulatory factor [Caloranaerobacter sp. TR13]KPU27836.1 anti-sigma regulatory factor [Caloranaerobacter sp. TR13]
MNEKNSIKLEYEILQNDFTRAGEASSNIKKILKQLGIEAKIVRKVAIATYEAEMNIVIHSYGGKIKVIITEQYVDIYAIDKGPGIKDIELAMKEGYSTAPNHIRELGFGAGMGLPNMKRCADEFNIKSSPNGKTEVYMRIYISK